MCAHVYACSCTGMYNTTQVHVHHHFEGGELPQSPRSAIFKIDRIPETPAYVFNTFYNPTCVHSRSVSLICFWDCRIYVFIHMYMCTLTYTKYAYHHVGI